MFISHAFKIHFLQITMCPIKDSFLTIVLPIGGLSVIVWYTRFTNTREDKKVEVSGGLRKERNPLHALYSCARKQRSSNKPWDRTTWAPQGNGVVEDSQQKFWKWIPLFFDLNSHSPKHLGQHCPGGMWLRCWGQERMGQTSLMHCVLPPWRKEKEKSTFRKVSAHMLYNRGIWDIPRAFPGIRSLEWLLDPCNFSQASFTLLCRPINCTCRKTAHKEMTTAPPLSSYHHT